MKNEENKASRASQSRVKTERKKHWTPPSYLDTPNAPNGLDIGGLELRLWDIRTRKMSKVDSEPVMN